MASRVQGDLDFLGFQRNSMVRLPVCGNTNVANCFHASDMLRDRASVHQAESTLQQASKQRGKETPPPSPSYDLGGTRAFRSRWSLLQPSEPPIEALLHLSQPRIA